MHDQQFLSLQRRTVFKICAEECLSGRVCECVCESERLEGLWDERDLVTKGN